MNKTEAKNQLANLQKEVDRLKEIIDKPENVFDVTSYAEVCARLGRSELSLKDFAHLPLKQRRKALYLHQIQNLEEFYNQGCIPDWDNRNESKYYPYYEKLSFGGWRFAGSLYGCYVCGVGAAFYKDKATSDFVGKTYMNIYTAYIEN